MKIKFWAVAEHHAYSIRRVYLEMVRCGNDVSFSISPKPPKHGNLVTSSGLDAWAYGKPHNRIIYINHGLCRYEVYSEYPKVKDFKGVMFPGLWWKNQMRNPPTNSVVGWPKTDILFDPKFNIDWLRRKINKLTGLPTGRVILYMSSFCHHSGKMTLRRVSYAKALAEVGHKLGFNILLKPHPGMLKQNFKLLVEKLKKEKNIYVLPLHWLKNSVALFPIVDALASEHSGSLIEFLVTGKPSVQLTPLLKYRKAVGGVLQADIKNLYPVFSSLKPHPEATKWRKLMIGEVDGKASERAANFIQKVFH